MKYLFNLRNAFYATTTLLCFFLFVAICQIDAAIANTEQQQSIIIITRQKSMFDEQFMINPYYNGTRYDTIPPQPILEQCSPESDSSRVHNEGMVRETSPSIPDFRENPAANAIDY